MRRLAPFAIVLVAFGVAACDAPPMKEYAYPAWGSAHVGGRNHGNPVREVGTTELWLPAA